MKIIVVGNGAAGWMTTLALINAHKFDLALQDLDVHVCASPSIPSIGVGESNTLNFVTFHEQLGVNIDDMIPHIDATVKTGVYYDGWSKHSFLHNFKGNDYFDFTHTSLFTYLTSFTPDKAPQHYYNLDQTKAIKYNHFHPDSKQYPFSFHFDAGLYIKYLRNLCQPHITFHPHNIINATPTSVTLDNKQTITADYIVFATGQHPIPNLPISYTPLNNILLTNHAFICPLPYTNKRKQFTPYTKAVQQPHGWRWITPTYSRIGTGYVYSSNHISHDEAYNHLKQQIHTDPIGPIPFTPRYNPTPFTNTYCTVGMASGFLEPLDAPGLSLSIMQIEKLLSLLLNKRTNHHPSILQEINSYITDQYINWTTFILAQYKSAIPQPTTFWQDQQNVNYTPYNNTIQLIQQLSKHQYKFDIDNDHIIMLLHSMLCKQYNLNLHSPITPYTIPNTNKPTVHHLDYINQFHNELKSST